jgi:hypothetical protein
MYWLLRKAKDTGNYKNLSESVKQHGISNHTFIRTNKVFNNKQEGEEALRSYQLKIQSVGKLMNDSVVETERYECEKCGMKLKRCYKEKHDDVYCSAKTIEFLDMLDSVV